MKTNAKQRSMKHLRDLGWQVEDVEKWIPPRGKMKFGVRKDVWKFGDLLACKPRSGFHHDGGNEHYHNPPVIALIQCCPGASHAAHKAKILAIPEHLVWERAGGLVLLHSWTKKGPRGKAKHWELREEIL